MNAGEQDYWWPEYKEWFDLGQRWADTRHRETWAGIERGAYHAPMLITQVIAR